MLLRSLRPSSCLRLLRRTYTSRNILSVGRERGLVCDIFPADETGLLKLLNGGRPVVYAGFDPTADSLHVGNLAVLMLLLHCQRAGVGVVGLVGGATGLVGDPSGKNTERPELGGEVIEHNVPKIQANIRAIFDNHASQFWDSKHGKEPLPPLVLTNNMDWYKSLSALDLIGGIGRHFRLGQMLGRQSVSSRLDADRPISFTEFSYQVFQSYDWLVLRRKYGVNIQIGGSDQMGNIVSGQDLISRADNKEVYGITVPLVTTEAGSKYGKSAGNAVWLDPQKTSPFELYQFFLRSKDSEVEKLLKMFTFLSVPEIEALLRKHEAAPEKRKAQTCLATNVTSLVHGSAGLLYAETATRALYSEDLSALAGLEPSEVMKLFPSGTATEMVLEPGTTILDMAVGAGCFKTKNDALRIIEAGGFFLNYARVGNWEEVIVPGIHILPNSISLARVGKKNYTVIKWT